MGTQVDNHIGQLRKIATVTIALPGKLYDHRLKYRVVGQKMHESSKTETNPVWHKNLDASVKKVASRSNMNEVSVLL